MNALIDVYNVWESSKQVITGLSVNSRELSTNNYQITTEEQGVCKLHLVPSVYSPTCLSFASLLLQSQQIERLPSSGERTA